VAHAGRQANLYIFAWHPVADAERVDHRDPAQWRFYVAPSLDLPGSQKTIRQSVIARRFPAVGFSDLRRTVDEVIARSAPQ
jgi:hypothetical protein